MAGPAWAEIEGAVRAELVTVGRRSGRPHTVRLRGVIHRGDFYFSRHRPDSDWFLNALAHPRVTVLWEGLAIAGTASQVTDVPLERRISSLKYPGDDPRGLERRVAIRVAPSGGAIT